jgi:hypothetical protein
VEVKEPLDEIELLKLINCCKKLEELEILHSISNSSIIKILKAPNLKSLKLNSHSNFIFEVINLKFLADFKEHCRNLNFFRFPCCAFDEGVIPEIVREEFKEIFKTVKVVHSYKSYFWEMKKL